MEKYKILVAADSFKGSATSLEVEEYIARGIRKVDSNAAVIKIPIADGGEGTVDALVTAKAGEYHYAEVTGPLGNPVKAKYGLIDEDTAVIEMAEATGINLVAKEDLNPFQTTSYGTGELILAALEHGVKKILIGVGGSATNDGGAGMAQALGVRFKDRQGNDLDVRKGVRLFKEIETIDIENLDERVLNTEIIILSDVSNPLCGENGASYVFGPQKGASKEEVKELDALLYEYGTKIEEQLGIDIIARPGSGAAGGLGAGLMAFAKAEFRQGIQEILQLVEFEKHLADVDLVITGEGRMDAQSLYGKAPVGIAKRAKKFGKPVIAIVGSADSSLSEIYAHGIDLVIDIVNEPMSVEEAMNNVAVLVENAAETAFRAFLL